jgi:preprotein translocase subunit SecF
VLIEVFDKHDTPHLVDEIQAALSATVPGGRIDVRQLETGAPVGVPVSIRVSGEDIPTLRQLSEEVAGILRAVPTAARVRDNWGPESFAVRLRTDSDKANMSGLTNYDVAAASASAMSGVPVATLREGDEQIPVVARLRMDERAQLADIRNLYVYGQGSPGQASSPVTSKVPLQSISSIVYEMQTEKLQRRNQFRTITISAFPKAGLLPSEVLTLARPQLDAFAQRLPDGYRMEIGGEHEEQVKGFKNLSVVMLISIVLIYLALVFQFKHALKPLIVFAAIPYGIVGALAALWVMGTPFGFMAFLGVASLIGVIVSHIIVLFDFIEERHEQGEPLQEALLDAGIMRLRPVLITVAATVIALFPLAAHGGPLWEPLCYAQIGGLTFATFVTLLLVPVIYATFVIDLKLVRWDAHEETELITIERETAMIPAIRNISAVVMAAAVMTAAGTMLPAASVSAQSSVTYDFDRSANFASFKTYAWVRGTEVSDRLNHERIVAAVDTQLAQHGLSKAASAETADVLVAYHASFDKNLRINGFSSGWGGYRFGGMRTGTATTEEILVGTLVIDVVQANTKTIVWRGTATGEVNTKATPEKRDKNINRAAAKIFKNYPPKPQQS